MMEQRGKRRTLYSWLALGVFLLLPPISFGDFPRYATPLGALVLFFTLLPLSRLVPGLKKLIPLTLLLALADALALYGFLTEGKEALFTKWSQWAGGVLALCFLFMLWRESSRAMKQAAPEWRDKARGPILRYVAVSGIFLLLGGAAALFSPDQQLSFVLEGASVAVFSALLICVLLFLNLHMLWGVWYLGYPAPEQSGGAAPADQGIQAE